MTNQHFKYTIETLESFVFTLSEDSGKQNIFSAFPQETKRLSVRDKIIMMILNLDFHTEIHHFL